MRTARTTAFISILCVSLYSTADAANLELQNDGFVTGMAAGFQAGFVAGEIGAVRLDPPAGGPYQLTAVTLLFGGATTTQNVTLTVWNDVGADNPGAMLYEGDWTLTGANDAFSVIDLSAESIFVSGPFRVGITFQHNGLPSIARDADGTINAAYNFILAQGFGWVQSNLLGLTGDWVIRATINDGVNPMPDAGVPDASVMPDASVVDASVTPDASTIDANVTPDAGVVDANVTPDAGGDGQSCRVHSECPTGQYCADDDTCTYDCRVDTDCGNNMRCTSLGMCEPESDGGCSVSEERPAGSSGSTGLWILGLGLFLLVRSRRRRSGLVA